MDLGKDQGDCILFLVWILTYSFILGTNDTLIAPFLSTMDSGYKSRMFFCSMKKDFNFPLKLASFMNQLSIL
jgi:hypothetical protein